MSEPLVNCCHFGFVFGSIIVYKMMAVSMVHSMTLQYLSSSFADAILYEFGFSFYCTTPLVSHAKEF